MISLINFEIIGHNILVFELVLVGRTGIDENGVPSWYAYVGTVLSS